MIVQERLRRLPTQSTVSIRTVYLAGTAANEALPQTVENVVLGGVLKFYYREAA
jgi:hypothetical protein